MGNSLTDARFLGLSGSPVRVRSFHNEFQPPVIDSDSHARPARQKRMDEQEPLCEKSCLAD